MSCAAVATTRLSPYYASDPTFTTVPTFHTWVKEGAHTPSFHTPSLRYLVNIAWAPKSLDLIRSTKESLYFLIRETATGGTYGFGEGVSRADAVAILCARHPKLAHYNTSPAALVENFNQALAHHPILIQYLPIPAGMSLDMDLEFVPLEPLKRALYHYLQDIKHAMPLHHKALMEGVESQISPQISPRTD